MSETFWAIRCVYFRYLAVFRKNFLYSLMTTIVEPGLYLLSFGFGLAMMIKSVPLAGKEVSYRAFVLSGFVGQSVLFQGFFEAAYGGFVRMYYQKIFKGMATTPVTMDEVLWGELIWDATKGTLSAGMVIVIGSLLGDFSPLGGLLLFPICFVFCLIFAGLGLWVSSVSRTIEQLAYPQYLFVFPMFLFGGVYFPMENLPPLVGQLSWLLPLTPCLQIVRGLLFHIPIAWYCWVLVAIWALALPNLAHWSMKRRLVK